MGEKRAAESSEHDRALLFAPLSLPCGRTIPNRLVKVALYEHLAPFGGGYPNKAAISLYKKWSEGGWGMILTGNIQVRRSHLSLGRDFCIPAFSSKDYAEGLDCFRKLANAMHGEQSPGQSRPLAIMQLNHPGRQSPRFLGGRPWWKKPEGASAIPLGMNIRDRENWFGKLMFKLLFQAPEPLSTKDISLLIEDFKFAALAAFHTDFDGVELHASHGYLLSQFMSRKTNTRSDKFRDGLQIIVDIIHAIRSSTPASFIIGVKLNSGDYLKGGLGMDEMRKHAEKLALLGVDFIEISGGDYEDPDFLQGSGPERQAFFVKSSQLIVDTIKSLSLRPNPPLVLLTGGFRKSRQMAHALQQGHCDILGLGRPAILCPNLPSLIREERFEPSSIQEPRLPDLRMFPKLVGASLDTTWYDTQISRIAAGRPVDSDLGSLRALLQMWLPLAIALLFGPFLVAAMVTLTAILLYHLAA